MTLRSYLALLTLAALLPVAILATVIGAFLLEKQRETFRRGAEERTLAMVTAVDSHLRGSVSMVQALAVVPSLAEGNLADFRRVAASVLASQPDWITINVALPSGQQVLNLRVPDAAPISSPRCES